MVVDSLEMTILTDYVSRQCHARINPPGMYSKEMGQSQIGL